MIDDIQLKKNTKVSRYLRDVHQYIYAWKPWQYNYGEKVGSQ